LPAASAIDDDAFGATVLKLERSGDPLPEVPRCGIAVR
jgi:hypothetical protein